MDVVHPVIDNGLSASHLGETNMAITRTIQILFVASLLTACTQKSEAPASQPATTTAARTPPPAADGNIREFKIGLLSAIALKDGDLQFPNDGKTFGVGHSPEEIASLLRQAGVATNEFSLSIQPLLVRAGDKVLLFDTGAAANMGASGGKLAASLRQAGVDPASVTDVFISHAHGDHVGGLIDANGAAQFTNATIHMSAPEWDVLKGMDEKDAATVAIANHAALLSAVTPKIDAFAPGSDIVAGIVEAVDIKGHTPGHSGYLIGSGADSLLYIGDMAHHYIVSVQEPDWTVNFDRDAPTAQASRKEVIAQSAASGQRIYAVHFPFPGVGKFAQRDDKVVWAPEQ